MLFLSNMSCRLDCWTSAVHIEMSNCSARYCQTKDFPAWCFTSLLWHSLYSPFQAWLIISPLLTWLISLADHIVAGYRKLNFFCWSWQWDGPLLGGFWRLFSHPGIKLSAVGPVLHCWEEHPDPNEVHKGTRVCLFLSNLSNAGFLSVPWSCIHKQMSAGKACQIMTKD